MSKLKPRNPTAHRAVAHNRETAQPLKIAGVRSVAVGKIKMAAYNPRRNLGPKDADYQKLKRSIAEFGLVDPLVWNKRSGNLVGGHQRFKILLDEFGAKEVPVSVVDLGPEAEKTLNLALNKIVGEWDELALADVLGGLLEKNTIDATLSGFDEAEIKEALALVVSGEAEESPKGRTRAEMPRIAGWAVMVICASKREQSDALAELRADGYTVQAVKV